MFSEEGKKTVIRYYQDTFLHYYLLLNLRRHWGMHFGFYNKPHLTLDEAILNTNRVLADKAGIKPGMKVLDAGCGVGGSAIWLAKNIGVYVTGITLIKDHCLRARKLASQLGVADKTEFLVRDFRETGFTKETFDVVFAIESVCHAEDKRDFLREAKRVLKPGGKLVVDDGFQKKEILSSLEEKEMAKWLKGWAVPNLATVSGFSSALKELGFCNIRYEDVTQNVLPFSRWLYKRGRIAYPIAKVLEFLKVFSKTETGNTAGAIWQYKTLVKGLWAYMIFTADKPQFTRTKR